MAREFGAMLSVSASIVSFYFELDQQIAVAAARGRGSSRTLGRQQEAGSVGNRDVRSMRTRLLLTRTCTWTLALGIGYGAAARSEGADLSASTDAMLGR